MTDEEKKLLKTKGFKAYIKDVEFDEIIAWKKEIPEKGIKVIVSAIPDDRGFDISYKDKEDKSNTIYNDIDSIEEAMEACDEFLDSYGRSEEMDAVKPVFNADPQKIAEEVDELFRHIDGEEYDRAFPDREEHIAEMKKQIEEGEVEKITQALLKFDIEEMEAELKMRQYLIDRLNEYKASVMAYNAVRTVEEQVEGNYNNIDGIIGNSDSKVNIKMMISEYQRQLGGGSNAPAIDELELRRESET